MISKDFMLKQEENVEVKEIFHKSFDETHKK